jgi:hypothetical protein
MPDRISGKQENKMRRHFITIALLAVSTAALGACAETQKPDAVPPVSPTPASSPSPSVNPTASPAKDDDKDKKKDEMKTADKPAELKEDKEKKK